MSESWNTKLRSVQIRKIKKKQKKTDSYFKKCGKFQNLHLQPLPPNNRNLFNAIYMRFLDGERFYDKILTRQLCKKSLCCLPPNLNKFQVIFEMSEREKNLKAEKSKNRKQLQVILKYAMRTSQL